MALFRACAESLDWNLHFYKLFLEIQIHTPEQCVIFATYPLLVYVVQLH